MKRFRGLSRSLGPEGFPLALGAKRMPTSAKPCSGLCFSVMPGRTAAPGSWGLRPRKEDRAAVETRASMPREELQTDFRANCVQYFFWMAPQALNPGIAELRAIPAESSSEPAPASIRRIHLPGERSSFARLLQPLQNRMQRLAAKFVRLLKHFQNLCTFALVFDSHPNARKCNLPRPSGAARIRPWE